MKTALIGINSKFIHSNPAIYSLAAYSRCDDVKVLEYTINQPYDEIRAQLYMNAKDSVLMFSCYIWNISIVLQLAADMAELFPGRDIWVGGPEVSYRAKEILEQYPMIRGVMVSEGEAAFKALAAYYSACPGDDFENGGEDMPDALAGIKGIVYRQGSSINDNGMPDIVSLDEIPFWYRDEATGHLKTVFKNRILYYESQRGCPFNCSYCLSSIDRTVRFKSLENIKKDLSFFLSEGVPQVKFIDRTFNCRHEHTKAILRFLKENDNGITNFHFEVEGDILDGEEIELFSGLRPGLVQLEIGVQSTNPETLLAVNRRTDTDKLANTVAALKKNGNIHIHLDLIAGLPYENRASFINSFNEVYKMDPDELQLGFLKVLSGALLGREADKYGIRYSKMPPYEVLSTASLSYEDILHLKAVERMLEIYHNSNQFTTTLKYLEKEFASPFAMYERLAACYAEENAEFISSSRLKKYEILFSLIEKEWPQKVDFYREVLLYDLYLRENIKSLPEFAKNRKAYRAIKQEGDRNMVHREYFGSPINGVIEFTYSDRNPVTGNASVKRVE